MASLITSSSPATVSNTLSANQIVSNSFSSTSKSFAMIGIWLRFAFLSPRSILLYIGVSISNAAHKCRCNNPCSSRSSFIFFPNIIILNVYVSFLLWQITGKLNLALQMPLNKAFPYYSLSYWQITDKLKLSPEWDVFHISSRCCRVKWLNPFFLCCFFYQS